MTTRSHSCVGCGEPPSRGVNRICRASVIERHLGKVFRDRCGSPAVAGFTTSYALIGLIVLIAFVVISLLADLPLQAASTPTTAPQKKVMGVSDSGTSFAYRPLCGPGIFHSRAELRINGHITVHYSVHGPERPRHRSHRQACCCDRSGFQTAYTECRTKRHEGVRMPQGQ